MAKSVLLEFRGSKRRIIYEEDDDLIDLCEVELKKVAQNENVRLITDIQGYSKSATDERPFLLQRYSTEWREFVDVIHAIEIDDKDHLKVVPLPGPSPQKVSLLLGHTIKICGLFLQLGKNNAPINYLPPYGRGNLGHSWGYVRI